MTSTTVTERDLLIRAREFLSDESRWVKGEWYMGDVSAPSACCLVGALERAAMSAPRDVFLEAEARLEELVNTPSESDDWIELFEWNDDPKRTHAEVLALLDRAIGESYGT